MKIVRPSRPWEAPPAPVARTVPRRKRYGVEYGLAAVILCFISVSTVTAINLKPDSPTSDRATVRYQ